MSLQSLHAEVLEETFEFFNNNPSPTEIRDFITSCFIKMIDERIKELEESNQKIIIDNSFYKDNILHAKGYQRCLDNQITLLQEQKALINK